MIFVRIELPIRVRDPPQVLDEQCAPRQIEIALDRGNRSVIRGQLARPPRALVQKSGTLTVGTSKEIPERSAGGGILLRQLLEIDAGGFVEQARYSEFQMTQLITMRRCGFGTFGKDALEGFQHRRKIIARWSDPSRCDSPRRAHQAAPCRPRRARSRKCRRFLLCVPDETTC